MRDRAGSIREMVMKSRWCSVLWIVGVFVPSLLVSAVALNPAVVAQDAAAGPQLVAAGAQRAQTESRTAPATFFLVRHADRDGKKDALTEDGNRRAEALRDFLLKQRVRAIYSTDTKRTMGTAQPTAAAAKLEIISYRPLPTPPKEWFAAIAKKHAGESVLIVGHSNTVVPFVRALGGKTDFEFTEDDYHPMFIVSSDGNEGQAVRINYGEVPAERTPEKRETRPEEPAGRRRAVERK
ncbi:MAG: histidine phosphatase family protein [Planctomycetes bacterium]|nr:histidine phosphatase family protein [Planctomycetota bacterium]MCB9891610.1 histidine phosphatase family protein [Planctomycetota bacterium]MCB9917893.1 histidine phosphatase family protein [Planctomycetota bacterium]